MLLFPKIVAGLVKVGTIGSAMAGAGLVVEGARRGLKYVPHAKVQTVVAGPLDAIGTLLDPLDLAGFRAKKKEQDAAQLQAMEASAHDAGQARRAAEASAKKAEAKAQKAIDKANKLEKQVAAERDTIKKQKMMIEAEKKRRWATLAKKSAAASRYHPDPNQSNAMAMAALEIAKNAMNPPKTAADVLTSDMSAAAKSLVADIVDSINRMTAEPNYTTIVDRMARGDQDAFEEAGAMAFDYDGYTDGPDKEIPSVDGPCCSGCAYGLTCAGKGKGVLHDHVAGDEDDEEIDGPDMALGIASYYDEDEEYDIAGPDASDGARTQAAVLSGSAEFYDLNYDPEGARARAFNALIAGR